MKLLVVAGARPNFMKIAPLLRAAREAGKSEFEYRLVHTGQHYDAQMSALFFQELGIPTPDVNLEVGSGSHARQTAEVMSRFEPVCEREKPDWVVVVGDVNSTMACTLVCAKLGIKVAHIEAGLRSFDRAMPEEVNRIVTDALADLLLTPSKDANANLAREGVSAEKVKLVGNIMIDALVQNLETARNDDVLRRHGVEDGKFVYVTLHRPSNVDGPESLSAIMAELRNLAREIQVIFPLHPRTRHRISEFGIPLNGAKGMKLVDPIGYHSSLRLTESARLVLTDSGGLQEESTFFRTPCLTLRKNTERPITLTVGSNRLTSLDSLRDHLTEALTGPARLGEIPPFWDGATAQRCLESLAADAR